jgi:peptidyl-prolyl cis-trans isomerase SurA
MKFSHGILIGISILVSSPAFAAKKDNAVPMKPDIAAVVGQEVISTYDLDNRIKFIMVSSNLPMTDEVRTRLKPQVIRTLVDERLQRQDAEKNGIKVGDNEVQDAIASIEKDRSMQIGTIFDLLERDHIPKETFTEQIRAQLAWRKLVLKKLRPLVRVNEDEAKLVKLPPAAVGVPQEIKMAALTLPVDKPTREKEVLATALKLAKELRAGASFEEVSRQLSGRAVKGDEAFWVHPAELDPVLARALSRATAGMISEPLRTSAGFTLVKVYETRSREAAVQKDSEVALKEILIKAKPGAAPGGLLAIAQEVAKNPGGCEVKTVTGGENLKDVEIEVSQRREMMSGLSETMRTNIATLKPGEVSTPQEDSDGVRLLMLCERKEQSDQDAELDRVKNRIYQQKIELEAQKYMRNLRRNTFIDIR